MTDPETKDLIHRFLFEESDIRGEIVTLTKAFQDAKLAQSLAPELQPLFGEFLAGAAMISEILKFDGLITLQARGDGIVPIIMAEANHLGDLRGVVTAMPNEHFVTDDTCELKALPELIGKGVLTIIIDPSKGQRYQGIVPLDGAKLENCLSHYFEQSEQLPTFLVLFSNEQQCGGIFLQCLPNSDSDTNKQKDQWDTLCQLTSTMQSDEFFSADHPTLLYRLFHEQQCRVFEAKPLRFKCSCSEKRSRRALASLGSAELTELINEGKPVDIDCQFCGAQYSFSIEKLKGLLSNNPTLH